MGGLMCLQFILFYLLVPFEVTSAWLRCECMQQVACTVGGINLWMVRELLYEDVVCGFDLKRLLTRQPDTSCLGSVDAVMPSTDSSKVVSFWWSGIVLLVWHLGFPAGSCGGQSFFFFSSRELLFLEQNKQKTDSFVNRNKRLRELENTSEVWLSFISPLWKLIWGVKGDILSRTSCRNVNKSELHL